MAAATIQSDAVAGAAASGVIEAAASELGAVPALGRDRVGRLLGERGARGEREDGGEGCCVLHGGSSLSVHRRMTRIYEAATPRGTRLPNGTSRTGRWTMADSAPTPTPTHQTTS